MSVAEVARYFPEKTAAEILLDADALTEIRIRAERPVQLVCGARDRFCEERISARQMRKILLSMMDHSYYAREEELSHGFFTMHNGCRVGVCGSYVHSEGDGCAMRAMGSACIRIAREVPGCAEALIEVLMEEGSPRSALLISRPGMGKTTLLRDAARLLSARGLAVGIVDERHEIAACIDGVPTLDVGPRSDVADGCPRHLAMERLIRSMAPQVLITDEIGGDRDAESLCEASRRGVTVLATAHAGNFSDLSAGMLGRLSEQNVFQVAVLLDGRPGQIAGIRRNGGDGLWR